MAQKALYFFSLICVLILYGIALSVLYPAILVIFAREGTFTSCFMLNEAFALIRKNAAAFFTAWGLSMAAGLGVGLLVGFVNLVVGWVPCLGWMVGLLLSLGSGIYSTVVYAHLHPGLKATFSCIWSIEMGEVYIRFPICRRSAVAAIGLPMGSSSSRIPDLPGTAKSTL